MTVYYKRINEDDVGQRLDNYLVKILKGVPKSHIYKIIRKGEVRVNKGRAIPETKLELNDEIRVPPVRVSEAKNHVLPKDLEKTLLKSILYEDNELLVINKPFGIAVHGGSGVSLGIIEGYRLLRKDLRYLELVHRLDRDTSGCLLLAKKRSILRELQALFAEKDLQKVYWALVQGSWDKGPSFELDLGLRKNILRSGERMVCIDKDGKKAQTQFILKENFANTALLEVRPKTGRTHQIRVHSAHLGHSIVGDEKYGIKDLQGLKNRLYLHALALSFDLRGRKYEFKAPLDEIFAGTLMQLRREINDASIK